MRVLLAALLALLLLGACAAPRPRVPSDAPYLVVLGTAQDGGYPQLACDEPLCRAAREDPSRRRLVASALVVDPRTDRRWLIDATPDLPEQLELARGHGGPSADAGGRPPLFDGILLTHAHLGHYTGLAHLGREAYATETTPVHATERMGAYLRSNGPWSLLFEAGHLEHRVLAPGEPLRIAPDLAVTPFLVPHRPEFSDTVGFLVEGPNAAVLYLPDIDKWRRWDERIEDWIARADVALLDGTFFGPDELPGRDMAAIPHPFVVESLARFASLPAEQRAKVRFFHLNHSNPLVDPRSEESSRVRAAGMHVAADGEVHRL